MKTDKSIFQFKIVLRGLTPLIWRRILVPKNFTFFQFHKFIQSAMGWQNRHLHVFKIPITGAKAMASIGAPDTEFPDTKNENSEKIADCFSLGSSKALYIYDFGDDWLHEIALEKILPADESQKYPCCIAGERACPPEDCGGIDGYEELLVALADPTHGRHEELKAWVGSGVEAEKAYK